jgi:hypothetical protein
MERVGWGGNGGGKDYSEEVLNVKSAPNGFREATPLDLGARGDVVDKALRYKPTGRGFDSR